MGQEEAQEAGESSCTRGGSRTLYCPGVLSTGKRLAGGHLNHLCSPFQILVPDVELLSLLQQVEATVEGDGCSKLPCPKRHHDSCLPQEMPGRVEWGHMHKSEELALMIHHAAHPPLTQALIHETSGGLSQCNDLCSLTRHLGIVLGDL